MHLGKCSRAVLVGLLFAAFLVGPHLAGQTTGDDPKPEIKGKGKGKKPGELKKYEDVITAKAKTTAGVFTVHRIDDKVYFEISPKALGKLMLWTTEIAKAPAGVGWGGSALGNRVVRWERRGNKILLWQVLFEKRGDGKAIRHAVESANLGSIILSFNMEAEGKDKSAVIDVTHLFTSDVPEFSAKRLVWLAQLHRGGQIVPDQHRNALAAHVSHGRRPGRRQGPWPPLGRQPGQRLRSGSLQHDLIAGPAHAGSPVRSAHRLFYPHL